MSKNDYKHEPWICPKCGRAYAPWVSSCAYCGQHSITYTNPCPCQPWWWYCNGGIYTTTATSNMTLNSDSNSNTLKSNQFTSGSSTTTITN